MSQRNDPDLNGFLLQGDVAIVTGAASGMGLAIAELLGSRGAKLALLDVAPRKLEDSARSLESLGVNTQLHVGSVEDPAAAESVVEACVRRWGRVDVLVNCAGVAGGNGRLWELSDSQWAATLNTNLTGTFCMCRATVPAMQRGSYGRIVNIASVAGKEGNPNAAHYSASKAGVLALTKSLGKELARDGILVNAVTPAVIDTPMVEAVTPEQLQYMKERIPMGRLGTPQEVAELVAFLCCRKLSFTTGAVFDISGGRSTY